jgi:hypothetical protein
VQGHRRHGRNDFLPPLLLEADHEEPRREPSQTSFELIDAGTTALGPALLDGQNTREIVTVGVSVGDAARVGHLETSGEITCAESSHEGRGVKLRAQSA